MDVRDLPSDSDSSDEDFVPDGADSDLPSEEESGPEDADLEAGAGSGDEDSKPKGRKRAAKGKGGNKKKRTKKNSVKDVVDEVQAEEEKALAAEEEKLTVEQEKKKADSLWADFMKDVGGPVSKKTSAPSTSKTVNTSTAALTSQVSKPVATEKENKVEKKVTITQIFEFAGEEVKVTKEVPVDSPEARLSQPNTSGPSRGGGARRGGGLSAVLSQIGKKSKISTLEKSKLDWERYKSDEGLNEEIQTHNRGKDGFLEKQDFLQRTDLRQFEIEKQLRANRRSNR
ncbi:craniofacial development protein 1 [Frankliniella occidentalis]|uniref:Craniofacial development protein 1 n=1 Tax=Frankliniella occidentalis TaxID=133901 RepID=A0A6J1RYR3_FRAOC|nr:craniofacial development protein 1 [Frankliniella occidentalis]XP_026274088.1 craniofacial development protein 1 [Frankliniella occidentalis]XP_026274089.1 craniofacial development protein 1 [Frankliniella occidentalis]XP_052122659.1 craniofacial development protein 1 [Frankliniella occidentalis]